MTSSTLISFFVLRESYAPTILARKAARLCLSTSNRLLRSRYELATTVSRTAVLTCAVLHSMKMLLFSSIVLALSAYMALVYGYLHLRFTTLTEVFKIIYHFPTSVVGLTYLDLGVGMVGGIATYGFLADQMTFPPRTSPTSNLNTTFPHFSPAQPGFPSAFYLRRVGYGRKYYIS